MKAGWSENKLVALLLLVLMLGLVTACGGAEEASLPSDEMAPPVEEEPLAPEEMPTATGEQPSLIGQATQIPDLSIEETMAEIDAQLLNDLRGNIAHSAPSTMQVDETAEVTLLVSPSLSPEELAEQITDGDEVQMASINITPWMLAELISPDPDAFTIRSLHGDAQQPLSTVEPTEWKWLVTAEEEGSRRLILVISRLVQVEGRGSWRQVEEYRYPVEVNITFGTRLKNVTAGIWDFKWWIGGIIFPIIVYWLIKRMDRPRL